jgi:C4-dicarboxylate transporter DctM subunit
VEAAPVLLFVLLFLLLLSRMPIAGALGLTSFLYFFYFTTIPLEQVPDTLFNALNTFPLMAIPFFILAANIMSQGGISRRLIAAANASVGQFSGGLAMTAVLSCMFFAAISGSSPATVVAVGTLLIPAMIKAGYGRRFGTGLIATSGSLGILIPPSITLVIYGVVTEQSIGQLFIAGIVPGLMAGFMLLGLVIVLARWRNLGHDPEVLQMSTGDRLRAFRDASLSMLLPILVLGGIYTDFFTPTEAAAMAVLYAVIISALVYGEMNLRKLMDVVLKSARMSAMVMFITANAILFTHVLASERIPAEVTGFFLGLELSKWLFLLFVNILLLVLGTFMETSSAVLILAPILLPVAMELGVDPIHFGIIMIMNLEIGMITPPLGFNLGTVFNLMPK